MESSTKETTNEAVENYFLQPGEGVLMFMMVVLSSLAIITGNTLMMMLCRRSKDLLGSEVTTFLLLNVSVTDLLVGVANIGLNGYFALAFINHAFRHHLHEFAMCFSVYVINFITVAASSCFLLVATVDRYVSILYPFLYLRVWTMSRTYRVVACIWIFATCCGGSLLFWNDWDKSIGCRGVNFLPFSFLVLSTVGDFSLTSLMVVLNLKVYCVAKAQARRVGDQTNGAISPRNVKAARLIGIIIAVYVLFSLPLILNHLVVIIYGMAGVNDANASEATFITVLIRIVNSAANPIIAYVTIPAVRKAARKLVGKQRQIQTP